MVERVNTGGAISFNYSKGEKSKLNKEQKEDIEKGYDEYYSRKERERKKRFFIILLIVILIVAGILAWAI
ncbi:MAG: hypothetical protein Q7S27_03895 [Nanoarchaeota archaeon]|nr:hypothetical protein [Nanoarchaeota archaeon]